MHDLPLPNIDINPVCLSTTSGLPPALTTVISGSINCNVQCKVSWVTSFCFGRRFLNNKSISRSKMPDNTGFLIPKVENLSLWNRTILFAICLQSDGNPTHISCINSFNFNMDLVIHYTYRNFRQNSIQIRMDNFWDRNVIVGKQFRKASFNGPSCKCYLAIDQAYVSALRSGTGARKPIRLCQVSWSVSAEFHMETNWSLNKIYIEPEIVCRTKTLGKILHNHCDLSILFVGDIY